MVKNLHQTDYQQSENIDVDNGIYDCDCSSFAGFVLKGVAPDHYAMVPKEPSQPRPLSSSQSRESRAVITAATFADSLIERRLFIICVYKN